MLPRICEQLAHQLASLLYCATMGHTSSLSVRIQFFFTLLLRDAFCNFLSNCHFALSSFPNLAASWQGSKECDNSPAVRQPVVHSPKQSANQLSVAQYHCVEEARVRHEAHEGQHGNCAGQPIKQALKR